MKTLLVGDLLLPRTERSDSARPEQAAACATMPMVAKATARVQNS